MESKSEKKLEFLMQPRSNVYTHKCAALVSMSQSSIATLKKDVGGEIERQRRWRLKLLTYQEKNYRVALVIEGRLGTA